ncbi:MAG TPA: TIM-barrel domain-containing protein, partial [bacterium]
LGLSLSGINFCGADVGGFMGTPTPELFTHWIQLGTFTPLFRTHTHYGSPDQEPWSYGDEYEAINKKFIQLRYQLLPYLYQAFHQSATDNTPIMRPMIYEFQDDPRTIWLDDQFLFGDDFLIAPVYQENQNARKVYFPLGEWYDFWTDEKIVGPAEKLVDAPLEKIPIFIRAGAIVPMQETMNYVGEKKLDLLILHIYPRQGVSQDSFYEDDGLSFEYENGMYCITALELAVDQKKISLTTDQRTGKFSPAARSYLIQVHDINFVPRKIELNQDKLIEARSLDQLYENNFGWFFDSNKKMLYLRYPDSGKRMKLELHF